MEVLAILCLAAFGISMGIALYRRRLETKVKRLKKEAEKLEAEKARFII